MRVGESWRLRGIPALLRSTYCCSTLLLQRGRLRCSCENLRMVWAHEGYYPPPPPSVYTTLTAPLDEGSSGINSLTHQYTKQQRLTKPVADRSNNKLYLLQPVAGNHHLWSRWIRPSRSKIKTDTKRGQFNFCNAFEPAQLIQLQR